MTPTTSLVNPLREQVLGLSGAADPYPLLSVVGDYLLRFPEDTQVRAMGIKGLCGKGLVSVAGELARSCPDGGEDERQLQVAADQLAVLTSEVISSSALEPVYQANLKALRSRGAEGEQLAEAIVEAWSGIDEDVTFHQANDGNILVRATRSDGTRIWLPGAFDFIGTTEKLPDLSAMLNIVTAPFMFEGVGLGWLIGRVYEATYHTYLSYSPALFVVEPNLRALGMVLHIHDWQQILADERVFFFAGEEALSKWRDFVLANPEVPMPPAIQFRLMPWPGQIPIPVQETVEEVCEARRKADDAGFARINAMYAGRDVAYWAERYASADADDPLRVLCVTTRFSTFLQHSMNDIREALGRMGCQTRLNIEENDYEVVSRSQCHKACAEFEPDLIIILDHHRHEFIQRYPENVPFVCWIQDRLPYLFSAQAGEQLKELDFTIGYGWAECVADHGYTAERFMYSRLPVCTDKFSLPDDVNEALWSDAVYVSHHSETPADLHARLRLSVEPGRGQELVDAFYEETRELIRSDTFHATCDLNAMFAQVEEKAGIYCQIETMKRGIIEQYVRPLVDRSIRHVTLEWAADWADDTGRTFHLYGQNWDQHPRFARYHQGVAGHGAHLAEISRRSAMNLHMGLIPALHQRALEVLAAGGMVLFRHNPSDFYMPVHDVMGAWFQQNKVDPPQRVPMSQLPTEYVDIYREQCKQCGIVPSAYLEITKALLLRWVRGAQEGGELTYANLAFPDFDQLVFQGRSAFAERAEKYLANDASRHESAKKMRKHVSRYFTYDAVIQKTIAFISQALQKGAHTT